MKNRTPLLKQKIFRLEADLDSTTDTGAQLAIVDELSSMYSMMNPSTSKEYAERLLELARLAGSKRWRVRGYVQLGTAEFALGRFRTSISYLKKAWKLAERVEEDTRVDQVKLCRMLGGALYMTGDTANGMLWSDKAMAIAAESGDLRSIADANSTKGNLLRNIGVYYSALSLFKSALDMYKRLDYRQGIVHMHWELGQSYFQFDEWEKAISHCKMGLEANREVGALNLEVGFYKRIGAALGAMDEYDKARVFLKKALKLYDGLSDCYGRGLLLLEVGETYRHQKKFTDAEQWYRKGLDLLQSECDNVGQEYALLYLGLLMVERGDSEQGIQLLLKALEIFTSSGARQFQSTTHKVLAMAYEDCGDIERTLVHYKAHIELEREVLSESARNNLLNFEEQNGLFVAENTAQQQGQKGAQVKSRIGPREEDVTALSIQIAQTHEFIERIRKRIIPYQQSDASSEVIDGIVRTIDEHTESVHAWKRFEQQLQSHDATVAHTLTRVCPELTPAEIRICLLLRMNMSSKEIAEILSVSDRTVDTHRTSIRKKMGLTRKQNLAVFLESL